jgi:bacterioferritin-associated ferredoxin
MIVCHCFCVSDRQIRGCAREGAGSVGEVGRACAAGTGCGGCRAEIARIVEAELESEQTRTFALPILRTG